MQGDSLCPLLFCLAVFPLTTELSRTGYGYRIGQTGWAAADSIEIHWQYRYEVWTRKMCRQPS